MRLTTQQQRSATAQVVETMEQLTDASRQVSSTAQQIADASSKLADLAGNLHESTARSAGSTGSASAAGRRARRVRRVRPATVTGDRMQAVLLPVGADIYALPVDWVRQVVAAPRVTRLVTASSVALGLFNLRGEIVPLLDVAALLGVGETAR